jgi:hypothetical protein
VTRASVLALPLAALASATSASPISSGVYGNVSYGAESGDLGGIELQLTGTGADARVEFVFCEGWCSVSHTEPITPTEHGFAFDYAEQYVDERGQPAQSRRMHADVRRAGRGLEVAVTPLDDLEAGDSMRLKPLKARYGLAVADRD